MKNKSTFAQLLIMKAAEQKDERLQDFQDHWSEYSENYNDYNDCHGDYYDAE